MTIRESVQLFLGENSTGTIKPVDVVTNTYIGDTSDFKQITPGLITNNTESKLNMVILSKNMMKEERKEFMRDGYTYLR